MGHMLSTINPREADEIDNPTPLPDVGSPVVFCPRPGERRMGRSQVPAMVLARDVDNQRLDLLVIYDADDFISKRGIPRKTGNDQGWEPLPGSADAVMDKLEAFKAELGEVLFGSYLKPDISFVEQIMDLEKRIAALEIKRGPGRPPNPKTGED